MSLSSTTITVVHQTSFIFTVGCKKYKGKTGTKSIFLLASLPLSGGHASRARCEAFPQEAGKGLWEPRMEHGLKHG